MDHGTVKLNITLDSMRYHIIQALTEREIELPAMVNAAVDRAVRDGTIGAGIRSALDRALHQAIQDEVERAVSAVFWNDEAHQMMRDGVRAAIRNAVMKEDKDVEARD